MNRYIQRLGLAVLAALVASSVGAASTGRMLPSSASDEMVALRRTLPADQRVALDFLTANMSPHDTAALTSAFLEETIDYAYRARDTFIWAKAVPEAIFLNYVLPYANLDERRDAWRRRFFDELVPLVADCTRGGEAAIALNQGIFDLLDVHYSRQRPKANQSPSESIEAGMASCTGLSILLVDACRAVGIPARVVGTPMWVDSRGNHTWVEIWDGGWHYIGASESQALNQGWFSKKAAGQKAGDLTHAIYAASFKPTGQYFPLPWNPALKSVNAIDVTSRYTARAENVLTAEQVKPRLAGASGLSDLLLTLETQDTRIQISDFAAIKALLWQTYVDEIRGNSRRQQEQEQGSIRYNGKTMRYVCKRVGDKPTNGYPLYIAMHGGGGAPARVNDSQWRQMQDYYFAGVTNGLYLAPRGVNNAWNLHWVDASFACYDRIIENMIAFGRVDPNRIYLMGYSAGGDSTYQIPARAPDRWAAAAMSAGHPNGVNPDNYAALAFLIQVGERDKAYKRNTVAAEYGVKLDRLAAAHPGLYKHDTFIHVGRAHGFMDHDPAGRPQRVYADGAAWLAQDPSAITKRNCNSIHWLRDHVRDPLPRKVIWDSKTSAKRSGTQEPGFWPTSEKGRLHYWLGLDRHDKDVELQSERIVVELDAAANAISVAEIGNYLKFYLSPDMLDLNKAVTVHVDGTSISAKPVASLRVMVRSLLDRGDPNYVFPVCLTLSKNPEGTWLLE